MKNLQRDGLGELREKGKRGSHKVKEIPSHYINCDIYLNTYSGIWVHKSRSPRQSRKVDWDGWAITKVQRIIASVY